MTETLTKPSHIYFLHHLVSAICWILNKPTTKLIKKSVSDNGYVLLDTMSIWPRTRKKQITMMRWAIEQPNKIKSVCFDLPLNNHR